MNALALHAAGDAPRAGSAGPAPACLCADAASRVRAANPAVALVRIDSATARDGHTTGSDAHTPSSARARLIDEICAQRESLKIFAMSLCNASPSDAEDLVQETMARALARIDSLRNEDRLRPWTKRILVNLVHDRFRRREPYTELDFDAPSRMATPEQIAEHCELYNHTRAAIQKLSPPLRQVVGLVCISELSYTATAKVLDVPIGTVMSRLSRARKLLKPLLEQHQIQSVDAATERLQTSAWSWEGGQPFSEINTAYY